VTEHQFARPLADLLLAEESRGGSTSAKSRTSIRLDAFPGSLFISATERMGQGTFAERHQALVEQSAVRKRNRLCESPRVSSSITIRSTDMLSLPLMLPVLPHAQGAEADPAAELFLRIGSNATCTQNGSKGCR
jgi:hypothetical protein